MKNLPTIAAIVIVLLFASQCSASGTGSTSATGSVGDILEQASSVADDGIDSFTSGQLSGGQCHHHPNGSDGPAVDNGECDPPAGLEGATGSAGNAQPQPIQPPEPAPTPEDYSELA